MSDTNPSDFIRDLVLPEFSEELISSPPIDPLSILLGDGSSASNKETAIIDSGNLITFTERLTGTALNDVKNSTKLAELAANKKFDHIEEPIKWYDFYVEVLSKIGWNRPSFTFTKYESTGGEINLESIILSVLESVATGGSLETMKKAINALKALDEDSEKLKLWARSTTNAEGGSFNMTPVDIASNGELVMSTAITHFLASESRTDFLWVNWSSESIKAQGSVNKFTLNLSIYDRVRNQIIDKLGSQTEQDVEVLDI